MRGILASLLVVLATTGCLSAVEFRDPETRAKVAVERFAKELGPGGDVVALRGRASGSGFAGDVAITFGRGDDVRVALTGDGVPALVLTCVDGRRYLEMRGSVQATRGEGPCLAARGEDLLARDAIADARPTEVRADSAKLFATYEVDDGVRLRVAADARERVTRLEWDGPGFDASLDVEYGWWRSALHPPEGATRVAAHVEADEEVEGDTYHWRVERAPERPPLAEIDVRLVAKGDATRTAAVFPLARGNATVAGFALTFEGDGDATLTEGDRFAIRAPLGESWSSWEVVVLDTWADAPVRDRPVPAPPILLLTGLLGAALLRARPSGAPLE